MQGAWQDKRRSVADQFAGVGSANTDFYAPYGDVIVVFRVHKKSSPQEQRREYELAMKRKREAERHARDGTGSGHDGLPTVH